MSDDVTVLTYEHALRLLREIVEGREDYVYQRVTKSERRWQVCAYTDDGQPSCLIGHVLFRAGVPIERLALLDTAAGLNGVLAMGSWRAQQEELVGIRIEPEAVKLLGRVQELQDGDVPWGEAVQRAAERV